MEGLKHKSWMLGRLSVARMHDCRKPHVIQLDSSGNMCVNISV